MIWCDGGIKDFNKDHILILCDGGMKDFNKDLIFIWCDGGMKDFLIECYYYSLIYNNSSGRVLLLLF